MKSVDYSKTLSKEREYFKDAIRRTNESADKRVANANERNEVVVKKQAKNFIEDKAELESSYQKNIERLEEISALRNMQRKMEEEEYDDKLKI